jgi:hypothetical protein
MLTLTGKLRRKADLEIKGDKRTKLTLEYEVPRYEGEADLKLQDFFVEPVQASDLKEGQNVTLSVRAYVSGKDVAFSASHVLPSGGAKAA